MTDTKHEADVAFIKALAELLRDNDLTELQVKREYGEEDSLNVRVSRMTQAAAAPAGPGMIESLLPFVLIIAIFYFMLIRPQQKRMKDHREMVAAVRKGDVVVSSGGLIGKITKVDDDDVTIEVAPEVRVKIVRSMISDVRNKTEAAPKAANKD